MQIGDPEFFDIEQLKAFGIWPSEKMVAHNMIPYLKRMRKPDIIILEVGSKKAEDAVGFLEKCDFIKTVYLAVPNPDPNFKPALNKNISGFKNKILFNDDIPNDSIDLAIFDSDCNLELLLEKYYPVVRKGGIVCGNDHDTLRVKASMPAFRKKNKINTPLNVVSRTVWFWQKP